jgi:translocation and assembly module TamB
MRFLRSTRPPGPSDEPRRRGRWRRWVRRSFAGVAGLVVLVGMAVIVLLHSLDRPWLKRRLQGLVRTSAGVEIDYRVLRIELLSGAEIEGLVVQSPLEDRPFAPDLVRVGRVEARWSPRALLLGPGPRIERVSVSDVTLTVVVDEHGRSSFDALSPPGSTSAPGPTVPLSHVASKLLGTTLPVGQLDVDHVTLALVRTEQGQVSERTEMRGAAVTLATRSAEPTARGWRVEAGLGSPANPLELGLTRARVGGPTDAARAKLWVTVDATSLALNAAVDLRMMEQTLATSVSADRWLHAQASLRFDPTAGRTEVTFDHAEAGDGAVTAEASIEIPDTGDPIVRRSHGDIDVARLLGWLPAGLVPVTAERARVHYQVDSLVVGPVVHLSDGGAVTVDANLSNVVVAVSGAGSLRVGGGELSLRAQPVEGGGVAGRGSVKLAGTRLVSGEDRLAVDDLALDVDGQQGADGVIAGRVGVHFARVEHGAATPVVARDGHVELRVQGLHPDANEPLATRGDVSLSIELASLDLYSPRTRAVVDNMTLRAHAALEGHAPYAIEVEATGSRLRVMGPDGKVFADAPARIEGRARDVQPDVAHPAASRGVFHAAVDLGEIRASLDATKGADAVDFALDATARSLRAIRPLLPPSLIDEAPWDRMALAVRSSGRVEHLGEGSPSIRETTEVDVERPAFESVGAQRLSFALKSQGTALQHQADLDLRAQGLAFGGGSPSDEHVTLSATVDRGRPSLQFQLGTQGRAATKLSGSLSFEPSRRALSYEIEGHLAGLAPLAPFAAKVHGLDAFDLSELDVGLSARGALFGVVAGVGRDGTIEFEPSPARTAAVEGKADLRVAHFRWAKGDNAIIAPALTWHGDMHAVGARRTLDSRVELGTMHLDLGSRDVDLTGISNEASVTVVGSLIDPEVEVSAHLSVHGVEQDVVPEYPLGALAFALSAERGPEGVVHISDMSMANGLGGTTLAVSGNVDLGEGRGSLSVTTSLTQDLARLSTIPARFKGRGKASVEGNVTSPDLTHYDVRAAVKGEDVDVSLPRAGVEVDAANGEVPITVALVVGDNGVELQRSEKRSPYSMLRFADQHPLLSRSGFLSIARLKTPFVSIAPLVGNLEIEQNVISLRQFEMGVRGGRITGQCGVDWDGPKSTVELHVRASGVQSSHGEPFDGNIAIVFSAADRTVEGRAEILRIGERHLLDLLDLEDPRHVDPAMNSIRTALAFGYPDSLRLVFDHGFVNAHLELGGLARFVSIGEQRGIPMGPIVDKMLAPLLEGRDTKETP